MKAWTLIRVHVVILLLSVQGSAEDRSRSEIDVYFDDVEIKIQYLISEYDKDTQYNFLLDVQKLIDDAANKHVGGFGDQEENIHRVFVLRLLLLNKCFNERDYTYDLNNPPLIATKVSPPLWAAEHQIIVSGMRPEDIIDPEARRQYEEAIAENNRKKDKDRREFMLQDIINRQIRLLARSLANAQDKPERQGRMWNSIEATVESQPLKDRFLNAFISEIEGFNKLNEGYVTEADIASLEWLKSKATTNAPVLDASSPELTTSTIAEPDGESTTTIGEGENFLEPTASTIPEPEGESATAIEEQKNEGKVTIVQEADKPAVAEQASLGGGVKRMLMAGILAGVFVVFVLVFVGYNRRG